ncbi:MAG: PAS domain-containing protein, partial [Anaerolineae bacterium]|nr:PAS domain-containing protein [Anaerolineae bacterium]
PMHARGRVIGILSVMSHDPYTFSDEQIDVLKAIADQVGVALDNAQLYEETRSHDLRLSTIIDSVADAIIATDPDGRVSWFNHAAEALLDLDAGELLGQPLVTAPLFPALQEGLAAAMAAPDESSMFEVMLSDGCCLAATLSRMRSLSRAQADAHDAGWVLVLQDISRLKRLEEARRLFVQTAAHDLRNPLGIALSALVMLRDMCGNDPALEEITQIGVDSVNRMQDLLDDLLDLECLETGIDLNRQPLDVLELLRTVLHEMGPVLQRKQQTYSLDVPDFLPPVSLDEKWLRRALGNYLSNAHKYTPTGGHIVLRARLVADELRLEVSDTGPGIDEEAQSRLFERFYSVPGIHSDVKGTGLGLTIVKSVAEAHGGRAYVRSEPGTGSEFGLALPLAVPEV